MQNLLNNEFSRCVQSLTENDKYPLTNDHIEHLVELFPQSPSQPLLQLPNPGFSLSTQDLQQTFLAGAKKKSSPGLTGISDDDIITLLARESTANAFLVLANWMINGELLSIPQANYLKYGKGHALAKTPSATTTSEQRVQIDGIELDALSSIGAPTTNTTSSSKARPLTIGERFTSGVSRIALALHMNQLMDILRNREDFAIGKPGGCETIFHVIQARITMNIKTAIVGIDIVNAFNTMSRSFIFEFVGQLLPTLLPFVQWLYHDSDTTFSDIHGNVKIRSTTGVFQGNSLSMALFQLGISIILQKVRDLFLDVSIPSYADDITLVSPELSSLDRSFGETMSKLAEKGLILNLDKTFFYTNFDLPPNFAQIYPNLATLKHSRQGFKLLGAWGGSVDYMIHNTANLFSKIEKHYDNISSLIQYSNNEFPQTSSKPTSERLLKLIRYCGPSKASYVTNVIHPHHIQLQLLGLDKGTCKLVLQIIDQSPAMQSTQEFEEFQLFINSPQTTPELSSESAIIFHLMFSKFGLGIYSPRQFAIASYLGTLALVAPSILKHFNTFFPGHDMDIQQLLGINQLEQDFLDQIDPEDRSIIKTNFFPTLRPISRPGQQKYLSNFVRKHNNNLFLQALNPYKNILFTNGTKIQKLMSQTSFMTGSWMFSHFYSLTNQEAKDAICQRLGIGPFLPQKCKVCHQTIYFYNQEDHPFNNCGRSSNSSCARPFENACRRALSQVGLSTSRPQIQVNTCPGWIPTDFKLNHPDVKIRIGNKYGDFLVRINGRNKVVDATVTGVFRGSNFHAKPGTNASEKEVLKHKDYSDLYSYPQGDLIPMAFNSYGCPGKETEQFLITVFNGWRSRDPFSYNPQGLHWAMQTISIETVRWYSSHCDDIRLGRVLSTASQDTFD